MATVKDVRERIGRGVELLDADYPGWEARVDLSKLKLSDCKACILGQVYGDYDRGKNALDIYSGTEYGFNAQDEKWELLDREWIRFIGRRLAALAKRAQGIMQRAGLVRRRDAA